MDEAQAGIKIAGELSINNLRYAEDTTLMAESEEDSESKIMASGPISSVQFSHSVMSDSLRPHELKHARPPCLSRTPITQNHVH